MRLWSPESDRLEAGRPPNGLVRLNNLRLESLLGMDMEPRIVLVRVVPHLVSRFGERSEGRARSRRARSAPTMKNVIFVSRRSSSSRMIGQNVLR